MSEKEPPEMDRLRRFFERLMSLLYYTNREESVFDELELRVGHHKNDDEQPDGNREINPIDQQSKRE